MKEILELIYKLDKAIVKAQKFSEIGDKILEILSGKISIKWMSICTIKEDKLLISAMSSKIPSYFKEGELIPLKGTATEYVAKTGLVLYEEDLSKEQKFWTGKYHYESGIRSILRLPLIFEGKVFAVWVIASDKPKAYSKEDIELLKTIAFQISSPLRAFLLYEEIKKQAKLLETISNLIKIILSHIDINLIFHDFAEELKKHVSFERLSIGILEGEKIKYTGISELIQKGRLIGVSLPLKYTASFWVVQNQKTLIRKDLLKEKEFLLEEVKVKQGIRSTMHVPLIYKGKIFGTLNFSSTKPETYGEFEKFLVESLVSHISTVIALAYLYSPLYNHLTEVYNRRYFDEKLDELINYYERYGGEFVLILCDLDNFKRLNDIYGHVEGDRCLKEVAQLLRTNLRKTDLIFRYGGDEFAILMPNISLKDSLKVLRRLKSIVRERMKSKEITLSIGVSAYPKDGKTRTEIIDVADTRLLRAKKKKDLIVFSEFEENELF